MPESVAAFSVDPKNSCDSSKQALPGRWKHDCPTNRELVERVVALSEEVGRPMATRKQVVQILGMPH